MSHQLSRNFKGIWIPRDLWLDKRLTYFEKILAAEIDSLDDETQHCHASNKYFMEFFNENERTIRRAICKLKALGIIDLVSFDGKIRRLKSNLQTIYILKQTTPDKFDRGTPANFGRSVSEEIPQADNIDSNILKKISGGTSAKIEELQPPIPEPPKPKLSKQKISSGEAERSLTCRSKTETETSQLLDETFKSFPDITKKTLVKAALAIKPLVVKQLSEVVKKRTKINNPYSYESRVVEQKLESYFSKARKNAMRKREKFKKSKLE